MERLLLSSSEPLASRIALIQAEFPEVISESKIDFEKLKLSLGNFIIEDPERYSLTWAGKRDAIRMIQTPFEGTLLPMPDESIQFDASNNVIIEGENLEVLKLLQKSYHGKVKMIYIDPPYNTGQEFIYPDNYRESLQQYLRFSGQIDEGGIKLTTNTEENGRYHSNWLTMMYPRLFLARNLLKPDGLIFVSIDEHEEYNLRFIMNEIFGEENFVSAIRWEKRFTRSNNAKLFATLTETILLYRRSEAADVLREPRNEKSDSIYSNPDDDPRGPWTSVSYVNPATKGQRPNLVYPIANPFTGEQVEHPTHAWKYSRDVYEQHVAENRLYWGKAGENKFPRLKRFLSEMEGGMVPVDLWRQDQTGTTDEGTKALESLMGEKLFDFPKPPRLIQRMLSIATKPDAEDIVLDFFAGSGTTAQAVLEMNRQDGGNRRFVLVQLPEPTQHEKYPKISDVTRERTRRVIAEMQASVSSDQPTQDLGFRMFTLASSNFESWEGNRASTDVNALAQQLELFTHHLKADRSQLDLLYEIVLHAGYPLTAKIVTVQVGEQSVFSVEEGALLICLEATFLPATLDEICRLQPKQVVCLDAAFHGNDNLKTNTKLSLNDKQIEFRTV